MSAPGVAANVGAQVAIDAAGNARAVWIGNAPPAASRRARSPPAASSAASTPARRDSCGNTPRVALDALGNAAAIFPRSPLAKGDGFTAQLAAFDGSPPVFRDAQRHARPRVSATPFDVWSPVTTSWDFGDGTSAAGETRRARVRGRDAFTVTARARDQFGREAIATRPLTIAAAPPVVAPAPPPPVVRASAGRRAC